MNRFQSFALLVLLLFSPAVASADILLSYQGLLTDSAGEPIDGPVDLVVRVFDDEFTGTLLWSESHPGQPVELGAFSLVLGTITPIDLAIFDDESLWLEFEVDAETMSPRQRVTSVPFAARARCNPGDRVACYSGDATTRDEGVCTDGVRTCDASGLWSLCEGETLPVSEVCSDGLDNDCNGEADEGCSFCGDGIVDPGEACDPGLPGSCDGLCPPQTVCDFWETFIDSECQVSCTQIPEPEGTQCGVDLFCDGVGNCVPI